MFKLCLLCWTVIGVANGGSGAARDVPRVTAEAEPIFEAAANSEPLVAPGPPQTRRRDGLNVLGSNLAPPRARRRAEASPSEELFSVCPPLAPLVVEGDCPSVETVEKLAPCAGGALAPGALCVDSKKTCGMASSACDVFMVVGTARNQGLFQVRTALRFAGRGV